MTDLRVVDLDDPDLRRALAAKLGWLDSTAPVPRVLADIILAVLRERGSPVERPEPAAPTPGNPQAVPGPQNAAGAFAGLERMLRQT